MSDHTLDFYLDFAFEINTDYFAANLEAAFENFEKSLNELAEKHGVAVIWRIEQGELRCDIARSSIGEFVPCLLLALHVLSEMNLTVFSDQHCYRGIDEVGVLEVISTNGTCRYKIRTVIIHSERGIEEFFYTADDLNDLEFMKTGKKRKC